MHGKYLPARLFQRPNIVSAEKKKNVCTETIETFYRFGLFVESFSLFRPIISLKNFLLLWAFNFDVRYKKDMYVLAKE